MNQTTINLILLGVTVLIKEKFGDEAMYCTVDEDRKDLEITELARRIVEQEAFLVADGKGNYYLVTVNKYTNGFMHCTKV